MAGVDLEAFGRNASDSVQRMTGPQRVTLALAFAATVLGLFVVTRVTGGTPMSTLYADLDPTTAASVISQLDAQDIPHELGAGGRIIRVPSDQVHAVRLDLSAQGLPAGGEGWSILDDQGITTSAFDQRVGYQRAMEGELAKTIASIEGVAAANVHLAIPEHDLIVDDGRQPSASVLLTTSGSTPISPMQVEAIVNLVASSIEGLQADQVSVADETGRVLAAPGERMGVVGLEGDSQLRSKRSYETALEADLESLLAAVVGPGLAVVNVAADLDFDSVQTVTEQFQPVENLDGGQMMLAETTREELYRDEVPGLAEDGDLAIELPENEDPEEEVDPNTDQSVKYSLDERDATYAVDKVVTNAETAAGEVTSLSVAVLLDEAAVDAARVGEIEELVAAAAGIDPERGDALAVTLLPLNEDFKAAVEMAYADGEEEASGGLDLVGLIRTVLTALVALVVIFLGLRFANRASRGEVVESVTLNELEAGVTAAAALEAGEEEEEGEPADSRLQSLIANQTDDVAGVLRSWLSEADQVGR